MTDTDLETTGAAPARRACPAARSAGLVVARPAGAPSQPRPVHGSDALARGRGYGAGAASTAQCRPRSCGRLAEVVARPGRQRGSRGGPRRACRRTLLHPCTVGSVGRPYRSMRRGPSAKRFLQRAASRAVISLNFLGGTDGHRRHRHPEDLVVVERAVLERVRLRTPPCARLCSVNPSSFYDHGAALLDVCRSVV